MKYNGWENYETWCVHLWLSNDKFTYTLCQAIVKEAPEIYLAAERMHDFVIDTYEETMSSEVLADMYHDLIMHAFRMVDWGSVAKAFAN